MSVAIVAYVTEAKALRAAETLPAGLRRTLEPFGLSVAEVRSSKGRRAVVLARAYVVRYLKRRGWSFVKIGQWLGHADHSSAWRLFRMLEEGRVPYAKCGGFRAGAGRWGANAVHSFPVYVGKDQQGIAATVHRSRIAP